MLALSKSLDFTAAKTGVPRFDLGPLATITGATPSWHMLTFTYQVWRRGHATMSARVCAFVARLSSRVCAVVSDAVLPHARLLRVPRSRSSTTPTSTGRASSRSTARATSSGASSRSLPRRDVGRARAVLRRRVVVVVVVVAVAVLLFSSCPPGVGCGAARPSSGDTPKEDGRGASSGDAAAARRDGFSPRRRDESRRSPHARGAEPPLPVFCLSRPPPFDARARRRTEPPLPSLPLALSRAPRGQVLGEPQPLRMGLPPLVRGPRRRHPRERRRQRQPTGRGRAVESCRAPYFLIYL